MALKSTVFKADLQISDMNRNYYHNHLLTIACHPSETHERMMMRIVAFALNASEYLSFANGLTANDEADVWEKDLTGAIYLWVMVGLPEEKQIKKACSISEKVIVYAYGGLAVDVWFTALTQKEKFNNLKIVSIAQDISNTLANLVQRTMKIQCSIQDATIWLSCENSNIEINLNILKDFKN